jgi:tetratricopeptide (TPR) repeat protein
LLTIPGQDEWTIIFTRQLNVTNPADYKQDQDVLRVTVKPNDLPFSVETFMIIFNSMTSNTCDMELIWDKTDVTVPIETDIDANIMAQIDDAMNKDNRPYFGAAMYYLDNGKDLNKALDWFNKATEQNPKAYFMYYQKARCQARLGKKQDAIATAQKGIELAKEANNNDYVSLNEKLIASLK